MILAAAAAALLSVSSCWNAYDAALRHSAQAAHPQFVSYDESARLDGGAQRVVRERAHIDYRDDGTALVLDDRAGPSPIVTRNVDPGPPVLGPYGRARAAWMSPDLWPPIRTAANSGGTDGEICTMAPSVSIEGARAYHLLFYRRKQSVGLDELWVDAHTFQIRRVILTGLVLFGASITAKPTNYDISVSRSGPYNVVSHVVWSLGGYTGDYTFANFSFPAHVAGLDGIARAKGP